MKKEYHGNVYEIPLVNLIGGFGYIRFIEKGFFYQKNDSEILVQFLKLRRVDPIKSLSEINALDLDLFCDPFVFFGFLSLKEEKKWKKVGCIPSIPRIDYVPIYNETISCYIYNKDELNQDILVDGLGKNHYVNPIQARHLPTYEPKVVSSIEDILNYFWALELKIPNNILQSEQGMIDGYPYFVGGFWTIANYYYPIFKKLPQKYRGIPLPEGMELEDVLIKK